MTLRGLHTAIVTPFDNNGEIDFELFKLLVEKQVAAGIHGVVVCGSTGEGATISATEKEKLFSVAKETLNGRALLIAGTGSNDTMQTVQLSKTAEECGADAILIVTPYYNKPTVAGLLAHHSAIASATDVPQILYNVPGRTATNMSAETQVMLAEHVPTIKATKEASANLEQMMEVIRNAPSGFELLAGDDSLALPIIAAGGVGCIAVISNYAPKLFVSLINAALVGDLVKANSIQARLMPYYKANFLESNPVPVKYIMELLGHGKAVYRLPMCAPTPQTQQALKTVFENFSDGE